MLVIFVAILGAAILAGISVAANKRFSSHTRLPMQWGFDGKVTWTAPRILALSLTPILTSIILFGLSFAFILPAGRPGSAEAIVLFCVSLGFAAVHLFHLSLIRKSL